MSIYSKVEKPDYVDYIRSLVNQYNILDEPISENIELDISNTNFLDHAIHFADTKIESNFDIESKEFYIGITTDFNKRYDDHQRDPLKKHLKFMKVLWVTNKYDNIGKIEDSLVRKFFDYPKNINGRQAGGGRIPKDSNKYYLYVLTEYEFISKSLFRSLFGL